MELQPVKPTNSFYTRHLKRFFDVILSSIALICLSPILLIICILELIFHGRPIFYKTKRPGKDGKIFGMYKFRSMTNERGEDGLLLPEDQRITKFGHFLRRTSIDELAGLFNILNGDMSVIGPRPLLIEYLPLYNERHAMRHCVRPGLANTRIMPTDSKTWTWREQFENDIWYIEHLTMWTDIRMIWAVFKEAVKGADYRADDTRVPFNGENLDETKSKDEVDYVIRYDSIAK